MALGQVSSMRCKFVCDDSVLDVLLVWQAKVFLWRDVAKHGSSKPANHRSADRRSYMIVPRSNVSRERPERIKGRFVANLELFVHVLFDQVHGNVTRPLDHYLTIVLPGDLRQLAERIKFRKLCRIVGIGNRAWPQAIAKRERNVIGRHDFANLTKTRVQKAFLMMRQTPLCHY